MVRKEQSKRIKVNDSTSLLPRVSHSVVTNFLGHTYPAAEWIAVLSSRGSSLPRDRTHRSWVSCIGRQVLYHCTTSEGHFKFLIKAKSHRLNVTYVLKSEMVLFTCLKKGP